MTRENAALLGTIPGAHRASRNRVSQLWGLRTPTWRTCTLSSRISAHEQASTGANHNGGSQATDLRNEADKRETPFKVRASASELKQGLAVAKSRTNEVILKEVQDLAQRLEEMDEQHTEGDKASSSTYKTSQALPLPPLMDPRLIKARNRYKTPKALPAEPSTEFERALAANPFGKAP